MKILKTSILLLTLISISFAQTSPEAILSTADIDKFITTIKPIKVDLEKIGVDFENIQNPSESDALLASSKANAVFTKYGWDENYSTKITAITSGYGSLKVDKEIENLPAEQKAMMGPQIKMMKSQFSANVNSKDIDLINTRFSVLEKLFQELE